MDPVPSFDRADYVSPANSGNGSGTTPLAPPLDRTPALDPVSRAEADRVTNHAAYVRAIVFGMGAAIAGCALYAGVEIATGWTIGYVALAVGYMVGKAMKAGARGAGGRRYQVAAAILTYASVSVAAIPVAIHQYREHASQHAAAVSSAEQAHPFPGDTSAASQPDAKPAEAHGALYSIGMLLAVGLASPFMELTEGVGGIIGLFILFIGIRAAWQLTAGTEYRTPDAGY